MRYSQDMDGLALNFVHKRIGRGLKSFVGSGFNPLAAAGGFLAPVKTRAQRAAQRTVDFVHFHPTPGRPKHTHFVGDPPGQFTRAGGVRSSSTAMSLAGGGGPCPGLLSVRGPNGTCIDLSALPPGGDPAVTTQIGGATMGRFGAALVPGSRMIDRAVCLRGMVLGNDGLCYNSKGFRNSDRMWPRGRKPLLTGGEMRAISVASRAATRLTNTAVRLQEIGLIKKPVARRRSKKK